MKSVPASCLCLLRAAEVVLAALLLGLATPLLAQQPDTDTQGSSVAYSVQATGALGSTYIPMDSWMYPALMRLYSLGYLDTAFVGLRPWTRLSVLHMLEASDSAIEAGKGPPHEEALEIYLSLMRELSPDGLERGAHGEVDTAYTRLLGFAGTPLRDSFHVGQTLINDYGRPYQQGFTNSSGASGRAEYGRFSLYVRDEFQHAPSAAGYSPALFSYLSQTVDIVDPVTNPVQDTIPLGPISSISNVRLLEATASFQLAGHEFSFGKTDHWWGPGEGGAFAWSNNADNLYSFQIDRVEPLRVPLVSRALGTFRYEFLVGSLQGHTDPRDPWVHSEKLSFKPTSNLEFGFERSVIWGGRGHEPVNLHTFLRSFFSVANTTTAVKFSALDPGARFSTFDFTYRLPFVRKWLTLYTDSAAHDDINPIDAPHRAAVRPGIYLSHTPRLPQLDLRVEGVNTDPVSDNNLSYGQFLFWETIQRQGTTNKGFLYGDAIGRQDKGGQAWLTYHLSPNEYVQFSYRRVKAAAGFLCNPANPTGAGQCGTTQDDYKAEVVKRLGHDVELKGWLQYEGWKAPVYRPGLNNDVGLAGQVTFYPHIIRQF